MLGSFLAGSRSVRSLSCLIAASALLFALAGRSSAQQVQWAQSPINGHWYGAEYSNRSWTDSEALAVSLGGHLVTIRSQAEQTWIETSFGFASGPASALWFGYSDATVEGTWTWSSGDPATYTNWIPGFPNGGPIENYGMLSPQGQNTWLWDDVPNTNPPTMHALVESPYHPVRTWSWPIPVASGLATGQGCTGDFDGDGSPDYAVAQPGQLTIFLNDGHGALSQSQVIGYGTIRSIFAYDLNHDSHPDIVATSIYGVDVLYNNGVGLFSAPANVVNHLYETSYCACADFNGDGVEEWVLTCNGGGQSRMLFQFTSTGGFHDHPLGATTANIPTIADVNHDGLLDVVLAGSEVQVFTLNWSMGDVIPVGPIGSGASIGVAAIDVDADGDIDLVVPRVSAGTVEVWKNGGTGTFTLAQALATGAAPYPCALGDIDGDGFADAVVPCNGADSVSVFANDGTGIFSLDSVLQDQGSPIAVGVADVDGDGRPDILSSNTAGPCFTVNLNQILPDCNHNGIDDVVELQLGLVQDCNQDGIPDACDIAAGTSADCNGNGIPDSCDIAAGVSQDCNGDGIPDSCEMPSSDCNGNNVLDSCEIASNPYLDLDHNGTIDSCQDALLLAWGENAFGQCNAPHLPMVGGQYRQIAAGDSHSAACLDDGTVMVWGDNSAGQCNVPALPVGLRYVEVAAGHLYTVARRSDGEVIAWGDNAFGQCSVPALPLGLSYTEVAAGNAHSVACRSDGSAVAWGSNQYGQSLVPALPPGLSYVEVAAGFAHTVARRSDGSVVAWGDNSSGQCNVPALPPGTTFVSIVAGSNHALGRCSDGSVIAWGDNFSGQCSVPALPPGLTYGDIAAGGDHSLARLSDSTIVAWGDDTYGESTIPAAPLGLTCVQLAAGQLHSIALYRGWTAIPPFCFGDGSGIQCPCANNGLAGRGCENSASTGGAMLAGIGVASLSNDTVQLNCTDEMPTSLSILLQGSTPTAALHFGDGLRCAGGVLKRLYAHNAVGGVLSVPQGNDLSIAARSAALGDPLSLGSTRYYQVYYRDPSSTFCAAPTGSTFNVSNAVSIQWTP